MAVARMQTRIVFGDGHNAVVVGGGGAWVSIETEFVVVAVAVVVVGAPDGVRFG